ncbi:MAG TPA: carboxypeptidase-like regulatory domain-containing protein, partial [Thermoanaerobaculia bacterium]|nr:carboxypeptidase-like regulatory domain-containing protein [Thermoanaerobaculia bacterium]
MTIASGSLCRRLARTGWAFGLSGVALIITGGRLQAAEPPPARLTVSVAVADGSPVTAPYVAVVPEDAPWSRPAREAVLEDEPSVSWELPPGRYRIAAGAPGFVLDQGTAVELDPREEVRRQISLTPLVSVSGQILNEQGEPIPGATVAHARRLLLGYARTLSPLGEGHFADGFEATTDEAGKFLIHLHPEAGNFLVAQGAGRAPRYFPNLRLPGAAATLREVTLLPGASLAVRWCEEGRGRDRWERLQLVPADGVYPAGLDLGGVLAFWARPAAGGVQRWSSLPAGRYEVWLKAPPSGPHAVAPVRLGKVVLRRGEAAEMTVEMPPARGPEGPAAR